MSDPKQPELPAGQYAINAADKEQIRAFGRELTKFVNAYVAKHESFHIKLIAGGFQYFMMLQDQKANLLNKAFEDMIKMDDYLVRLSLNDKLEEPFAEIPVAPAEEAAINPAEAEKEVAPMETEKEFVPVDPSEMPDLPEAASVEESAA